MRIATIPFLAFCLAVGLHQSGAQTGGTSFYTAVRNNDAPRLEEQLKRFGPGTRDPRGTTPLMIAAALGSLDAMKKIVDAGTDVNAVNDFGATALMWCAGDIDKVRYLLSKGAKVAVRSKMGRTPLLIAATYDGSVEIGRLLITKGAVVDDKDKSGTSVLQLAATSNNLEFVRLLLEKGADANTKDQGGFSPLGQAAGNGDRSAELVRLLLKHGAAVNVVSVDSVEHVQNGDIAVGRLTPLLMAANHGNFETMEALVKAGANVNAQDIRGMTPLALSIANDRPNSTVIRMLIAHGADPNIKSKAGESALDWARRYRHPEVMKALGVAVAPMTEPAIKPAARSLEVALAKSVGLMQTASAKFLGSGGCLGCHAQHLTGMAVTAARGSGVKVNWERERLRARRARMSTGMGKWTRAL